MSSPNPHFELSPLGCLLFARVLPGLAAIGLVAGQELVLAGACLVIASLADLVVDSLATRRGWTRTTSETQIEGFVDFIAFIWAPVAIFLAHSTSWPALGSAAAFTLAGALRLARFNVTGMTRSGYVGLPVTYSGVVVPVLLIVAHAIGSKYGVWVGSMGVLAMAVLMASSRFTTPRLSL